MISCEYCHGKFLGALSDAYKAGWGYLRFQYLQNGRIISYCPVHKDDAFKEMLSVVLKVLTPAPNEGSHHESLNISG